MTEQVPNPEYPLEPRNPPEKKESRNSGRGARNPIPGVDEILEQLIKLNGAVVMGALSPKEAGLIQKNLKTVLDVQLKRSSRGDSGPSQEALLDLCRRDPRAISAVQAFLTPEQLQTLMDEITDDQDESV